MTVAVPSGTGTEPGLQAGLQLFLPSPTMTAEDFYDRLAPFYHLVYPDWEASVQRQAAALDGILRDRWGSECRAILDVACGIGTQALGLARLGYAVTGSDLSSAAVARAR